LLGFFALLSVHTLIRVWQGAHARYFVLAGVALGLGILTKGPVVFLPALFMVLTAPWWMGAERPVGLAWPAWYRGGLGAAVIAGLIAAAWLVPMSLASDPDYLNNMLFKQSAGYVADSFSHARPFWWYLPLLPAMLFPWTFWPRAWRAIASRRVLGDPGTRLCLAWAVLTFIAFSLISGKQPHYLLLMFPAVALLLARLLPEAERGRDYTPLLVASVPAAAGVALIVVASGGSTAAHRAAWLAQVPRWLPFATGAGLIVIGIAAAGTCGRSLHTRVTMLAATSCAVLLFLTGSFMRASAPAYDLRSTSAVLSTLEARGAPLAMTMHYSGEFNFYGRLKSRVEPIVPAAAPRWAAEHPDGYVIAFYSPQNWPLPGEPAPQHQTLHRGGGLAVWRAQDLIERPELFKSFK